MAIVESHLGEIDRLDLAAKAEAAGGLLRTYQKFGVFLSVLFSILAIGSEASREETLAVTALAAFTVITTIALLFRWRYSLHMLALMFFAVGVGSLLFETSEVRYTRFVIAVLAYPIWKLGSALAEGSGSGWDLERSQVRQWLKPLQDRFTTETVLELPSGSFWQGYSTYRLSYLGDCWAVATFKNGRLRRPMTYRIRSLNSVRLMRLEDGKLDIEIDGHLIQGVELSPSARDQVSSLLAAGV